jgi:hypothetical protein
MSQYEIEIEDDDDSGSSGGGGITDRKPFIMQGYLVQAELAQGEKRFGEIDWSIRVTEAPPENTQQPGYSEEAELAAANDNVVEQHPLLVCQQFDGRDPKRDQQIPSASDVLEYADNHPEAQLTLDPQLRLVLENAKRQRMSATPTLKPAGM